MYYPKILTPYGWASCAGVSFKYLSHAIEYVHNYDHGECPMIIISYTAPSYYVIDYVFTPSKYDIDWRKEGF